MISRLLTTNATVSQSEITSNEIDIDTANATWTEIATKGINRHNLNPGYFLPRAAEIEPEAPAIHHCAADNGKVKYTYQEFADRARGLAYYLKLHNFSRVAILAPNTPAHIISMFGTIVAGGVTIGLNYRLTSEEIMYKIQIGKADLVVVDREYFPLLKPSDKFKVLIDEDLSNLAQAEQKCAYTQAILEGLEWDNAQHKKGWDGLHAEDRDEDETIGLYYTSGTTGRPKAVAFSHRGVYLSTMGNIIESQLNCQTPFGENRCRYLWTLPMFHAAGWTFPFAVTAVRGTHICLRKIDPSYIWDVLDEVGVTHMCAAPTVNTMILNSNRAKPLSNPVRVIVAASPPSAVLFEKMIKYNFLPLHHYGLTETYGPVTRCYFLEKWNTSKNPEDQYTALARQGHGFMTSSKVRVVRDGNINEDVIPNGKEIGEIIMRGNIVSQGYFNDPEANASAFEGGWFHSGDLAVVHPDGFLQVQDRKKDVIISGGENISTVFVEGVIMQFDNVLEVAVVGIPDEHYGERPKAYITLKDTDKNFSQDELRAWLKTKIGGYQIPKIIEVVESLPKTSTGKIKKHILKAQAALQHASIAKL
ncbi:acetyl-CoA synthetase-like protein [Nadsonia fulvescens var. elongata DSM 6958]|uniref:Acetyl-CoA synthetase-like protein n=1 Tax=Nadsonia fulvescens var. elongata DSM 6958 TaxID=857566 RepID=A0A1E3PM40_9ASCO|nr:acetyl-CoA synthetase-like protein [Nadsonia fulvescens var. elongata DSM 6958]